MRHPLIVIAILLGWNDSLWAQQGLYSASTGLPPTATAAKASVSVGDFWTYDVHDNIKGTNATWTYIVTDVNSQKIAVRREIAGKPDRKSNISYDHNWNVTFTDRWNFRPSDFTGFAPPFVVGKVTHFQGDTTDYVSGRSRHRIGTREIVGREKLTTKVGTFDVYHFHCEWHAYDTLNPSLQFDYDVSTWFSPAVNHWVKQTYLMRSDRLAPVNNTFTLTAWGHGKTIATSVTANSSATTSPSRAPPPPWAAAPTSSLDSGALEPEDRQYLSTLFRLVMSQRRFPPVSQPRSKIALAVVAFWLDGNGALKKLIVYKSSGFPELDQEALAAVRRAAPFPPPPTERRGFIAQVAFPPTEAQ